MEMRKRAVVMIEAEEVEMQKLGSWLASKRDVERRLEEAEKAEP